MRYAHTDYMTIANFSKASRFNEQLAFVMLTLWHVTLRSIMLRSNPQLLKGVLYAKKHNKPLPAQDSGALRPYTLGPAALATGARQALRIEHHRGLAQ